MNVWVKNWALAAAILDICLTCYITICVVQQKVKFDEDIVEAIPVARQNDELRNELINIWESLVSEEEAKEIVNRSGLMNEVSEEELVHAAKTASIIYRISIATNSLKLLVGALLLGGMLVRRSAFYLPWLLFNSIFILLGFIVILVFIKSLGSSSIIFFSGLVVYCGFWAPIYMHYQELEAEVKEANETQAKQSPPETLITLAEQRECFGEMQSKNIYV